MKCYIAVTKTCLFTVVLITLKFLQPVGAQEKSNNNLSPNQNNSFEEVNQETQETIEKVIKESGSIPSAIEEQENNLAEQVRNSLPQKEIKQARGIYDTIDAIIDFFGGLSLDDFFGDISLNDLFDKIFGNLGTGSSSEESASTGGSSNTNSNSSNRNSISVKTGDIGLPDSKEVADYIKARKTSTTEELLGAKTGGAGSVVIKDDLRTLYQVNLAKDTADASVFSAQAQEKLKKKSDVATSALKKSAWLAQDSEEQDVTQNIMRNISTQMWRLQQTNSILALNAQIQQRDDAIANTLLAESLRELNGERVAKNRELSSAYSAVITHGAQFTLPGLTVKR